MLLLDRLAEYAKMDLWYLETYNKKTVTGEQLTDLFNAFGENAIEHKKLVKYGESLSVFS